MSLLGKGAGNATRTQHGKGHLLLQVLEAARLLRRVTARTYQDLEEPMSFVLRRKLLK